MSMFHKLLQRQIQKHLGDLKEIPGYLEEFLNAINETYAYNERDRKMLERSIDLSSREMIELNNRLREESKELLKTNHELKTLFENIKEVFFSIEFPKNRLVQMSQTCQEVYGYSVRDFEENSNLWFELILEEDKPIIHANYPIMNAGHSFSQEYRIRHRNGSVRWIESRITPTLDIDGQLIRLDGVSKDITGKKESEERLRKSEAHLLASQRIAKIGSWELDLHNASNISENGLFWTDETYRIFGYEPGEVEVTNQLFFNHVHPDDLGIIEEAINQSLQNHSTYEVEHRILLPNGVERFVSERGEIEFDQRSGNPLRMVGTVQDITDRKIAEQALKQAEANLRTILENTDTAYVLLDENANILTYNRLAKELAKAEMNVDLEEGMNYVQILPEYRREETWKIIMDILEKGRNYSYEVEYKTEDGPSTWLHARLHPIVRDQKVVGLSSAATDITDRKKIEKLIKKNNERYELVTKATRDIIWDWDIKNGAVFRSANYHKIFGYDPQEDDESLEKWLERIHPDDRERVLQEMTASVSSSESNLWEDEYRQRKQNGEYVYIQDRGYIIYNKRGEPVRMVGAMRDITQQKLLEIERQKITDDLIIKNQHLEQFAYIVSHNLRAPVANIIGFTELFKEPGIDKDKQEMIMQELAGCTTKLDTVIVDLNQILHEQNDLLQNREKVLFREIAEEVISSLKGHIEKEGAVLKTDFSRAEGLVAIKSYVHSIFFNLISNSLKYRKPDTALVIDIKSQRKKGKVILTFRDNGLGIDLNVNQGQIFGLYKRFHNNVEGKGMGLFMVKKQVESLRGTITLSSEVNMGTKFTLEFVQ